MACRVGVGRELTVVCLDAQEAQVAQELESSPHKQVRAAGCSYCGEWIRCRISYKSL